MLSLLRSCVPFPSFTTFHCDAFQSSSAVLSTLKVKNDVTSVFLNYRLSVFVYLKYFGILINWSLGMLLLLSTSQMVTALAKDQRFRHHCWLIFSKVTTARNGCRICQIFVIRMTQMHPRFCIIPSLNEINSIWCLLCISTHNCIQIFFRKGVGGVRTAQTSPFHDFTPMFALFLL